ncbi:MAG: DUF4249 family protein [Rhodothermaceae bacterium]|nr:DUF4249 family protein [Rhodothermaceae bacterium]
MQTQKTQIPQKHDAPSLNVQATWKALLLFCLIAIFSVTTFSGCEENVTAILGTDNPYTLYGVFTPGPDTQWVRVFPIKDRLELASPDPLDATFISTNLSTGETHTWRDSTTQDDRGRYSHVFWAPFNVDYGHSYRVEVTRSDGAKSWAEVKVPELSELVELPADRSFRDVKQPILVKEATDRLIQINVTYETIYVPTTGGSTRLNFTLPYTGMQQMSPEGWVVPIQLSEDIFFLREQLSQTGLWFPSFGVGVTSMTLDLMVVDNAWNPPDNVFDPDVLVQPGTLSNVENGFGFVGAGYKLDLRFRPENDVLVDAGFRPTDDGDDEEEDDDDQLGGKQGQ